MNERPRLIVVAGPNGSGKTSITRQLLRHQWMMGCDYINPDDIAEQEFGGWNDCQAILQAAQIAQARRLACLREHRDLAFETVFSTQEKVGFLRQAKKEGFFIRFFFVGTTSPAINAKRVTERYLKGGHLVPLEKIVRRYNSSLNNALEAATVVDRAYFYDNSIDIEDEGQITWAPCFRTVNGRLCEKYARPNVTWAQTLYDALASL